jgi:glutamate racemase
LRDYQPIGVFDSGFGGLTILKDLITVLPEYDYLYLGDNARAPYGNRSFDTIYKYTLEAVNWFFSQGCELVVLACNTASAKALRNIQQIDLPLIDPNRRVLGVIRPTSESVGHICKSNLGIFATTGTVTSESYLIEINKFSPHIKVTQQACPLWVPLIENNEHLDEGADYFMKKYIDLLFGKDPVIDAVLLGCTHYPLLKEKLKKFLPPNTEIIAQGSIVAQSLKDYLERHTWMEKKISKNRDLKFYTTDDPNDFNEKSKIFFPLSIQSNHLDLKHIS